VVIYSLESADAHDNTFYSNEILLKISTNVNISNFWQNCH